MLKPVLRIRILDPDPVIFVIDLQNDSKKLIFKHNFFYLLLPEATFRHFSKIKSKKIVGFKVFTILAWLQKDSDPEKDPDPEPYLWLVDPDPGCPKTCGSGWSGFGSATLVETLKKLIERQWRKRELPCTVLWLWPEGPCLRGPICRPRC